MIPLKDDAPRLRTPFINYFLITANIVVYLFLLTLPNRADLRPNSNSFVYDWGLVPGRVAVWLSGSDAPAPLLQQYNRRFGAQNATAGSALVPLFTSMFVHQWWFHLLVNMWFLWIFGDNVEGQLGHFGYLIFYLIAGILAGLTHLAFNFSSFVPTIGASGAIAGVMGAYFILFPSARVLTWVFVFFVWLPAWIVLGYWFVVQFLTGAATTIAPAAQTGGGIAVWAHVGGFVSGMLIIKMLPIRPRRYRYGL